MIVSAIVAYLCIRFLTQYMSDDMPLFLVNSRDPDEEDNPLPRLPPELVEMIVERMWRLEDQLLCRQVCRWWRARVGIPVRYDNNNRRWRSYLLNQYSWATLSAEGRVLRLMEFKPWGGTHLQEYSSGGLRVKREVIFRPPNKVTEISHEHTHQRRVVTTFHLQTHAVNTEIRYNQLYCAVL